MIERLGRVVITRPPPPPNPGWGEEGRAESYASTPLPTLIDCWEYFLGSHKLYTTFLVDKRNKEQRTFKHAAFEREAHACLVEQQHLVAVVVCKHDMCATQHTCMLGRYDTHFCGAT